MLLLTIALLSFQSEARDVRPASGECEWKDPGANPYMLDLGIAVDRLTDIPKEARKVLKEKLLSKDKVNLSYDHIAITNEGVSGTKGTYAIYNMNGGNGGICFGRVTTRSWPTGKTERGLVFCEEGHCIAYKSVCRNVSQVYKLETRASPPLALIEETSGGVPEATEQIPSIIRAKPLMAEVERVNIEPFMENTLLSVEAPEYWNTREELFPRYFMPLLPEIFARIPEKIVEEPLDGRQKVNPTPSDKVFDSSFTPVTPVPEPSTLLIMAIGLVIVLRMTRATRVKHKMFMPFFYPKSQSE